MSARHPNIIVIGCGSIGRRHIRNLVTLGIKNILAFDINPKSLKEVRRVNPQIQTATQLSELLAAKPDAAIIALPTSLHISYATKAAKAGCHLFIEKPLANNLSGLKHLQQTVKRKRLKTFIGYTFRFHSSIIALKKELKKKSIGKVMAGRTHFGSYLPDRHPGEDYRQGYGAKRSLGGGVILDSLSHHLDYLIFLLGQPTEVFCYAAKHSKLNIDVEDLAEVLIKFKSGAVMSLHGDSVQRPYKHYVELIGETGSATCDIFARATKIYSSKTKSWKTFSDPKSLDRMYEFQMKSFVTCLRGSSAAPVDLNAAANQLKILMKIQKSARIKRWVRL